MDRSTPSPRETQAVSDAVELAFWGVDFRDDSEYISSFLSPEAMQEVFDCKVREREGHDYVRGHHFTAIQARCFLYDEGSIEKIDMVFVFWEDGLMAAINTIDPLVEQRTLVEDATDEAIEALEETDPQTLIAHAKTALAQLTDMAS